jgi:hypothetical protein
MAAAAVHLLLISLELLMLLLCNILHNAHSELHAAAADDGACFRLHEHGRCFDSGKANHRRLRHRSHA